MSRATVTELKAKLSRYLREVCRGGEVEILDRGMPVARLVAVIPLQAAGEERRARLVRSGILRQGVGDMLEILKEAPLEVPTSILEALEEERGSRV